MKRTFGLVIALALIVAVAVGNSADVIFRARLSGDGVGKAVYKYRPGTTRQPELQVEGEDMEPNTPLVVAIAGKLWQVETDEFGTFTMRVTFRRPSDLGVVEGTRVKVFYTDQTVALAGKFIRVQ